MDSYEQKYKEALERAKAMIKVAANQDEAIGFANTIFPELKESEDEKIRKELYDFCIKCSHGSTVVNSQDDFAALATWLEQHGSQKPTDNEMKEALRTEYEKGRADAIAEMQNLAWSEEDDLILETIIDHIIPDKPFVANGFTDKELVTWLKSLRPQPKKEWSEEDESIALGIEQIVNCASLLNIAPDRLNKVRDWLKSLNERVQPKEELGEENTRLLDNCISLIEDIPYTEEEQNWLKSLRPQNRWKPSDEQMKALHDMNLTGNISYAGQGKVLIELYDDLKRLLKI